MDSKKNKWQCNQRVWMACKFLIVKAYCLVSREDYIAQWVNTSRLPRSRTPLSLWCTSSKLSTRILFKLASIPNTLYDRQLIWSCRTSSCLNYRLWVLVAILWTSFRSFITTYTFFYEKVMWDTFLISSNVKRIIFPSSC